MSITQRTRKILWTRAANRCAICKLKLTTDPTHGRDQEAVLGSECHIVARSIGGSRSGEIASSQIDDYSNLILLCPSDHKLVDDQPGAYSSERLAAIKRAHEQWVNEALDWRATLTDELWARVKQEADALMMIPQHDEESDEPSNMLEGLGIYSYITAEFLAAPELLFFARADGGEVALAYKYERGAVRFAHASRNGFPAGFSAFATAPAIEDHTGELSEAETMREDDESGVTMVHSVAATLRDLAELSGIDEGVMYARASPDSPELGFRYLRGKVELAAGPSGTFVHAYRSFAQGDPVDISEGIRLTIFTTERREAATHEADRGFGALMANHIALNVHDDVGDVFPETRSGDEQLDALTRLVRDRCFEGILMLRVAQKLPDDPRVQEWVEDHADPEPQDGLSAVLPSACIDAIHTFISETGDSEDEGELMEVALDSTYELIGLVLRSQDDDAMEALAGSFVRLSECWEDPVARPEILELVRAADGKGEKG